MEIRGGYRDILSVITTDAVVEGRFGLLTTHVESYGFGSREDLPGWKIPATAEEAKRARFLVAWAVDNRPTPILSTVPSTTFNTRRGYGSAANAPFSATVYLTQPNHQEGLTIPSGIPALAFNGGTFTLASGEYIDSADIRVIGAMVVVANTAEDTTDAGKLKYQSTMDERVVGVVREYVSSDASLTVRLFD